MNDSLKEFIKEVIKDFFIITVAMLFVVSLANSIAFSKYKTEPLKYSLIFSK